MKKLLLLAVGVIVGIQSAFATTCPGATPLPATPTFPYVQSLTCGAGNDITAGNSAAGPNGNYLGGQEAVYVWTPTEYTYSGVSIAYSGVTWVGIFVYAGCPTSGGTLVGTANAGGGTSVTLNVPGNITAGTTYYIVIDTWPTPNSPCPGSFTLNGTIQSAAVPPTPLQDPAMPTCLGGSQLTLPGAAPANAVWYWQTSATGTSTANPGSSPYTVFANGTYYARSLYTPNGNWSAASSVVVNNFPLAATPPAPVPAVNPACVTSGTTISVPAAPAGTVYYWQGTTLNGTSNAQNAATPYAVSTTGTYHVAAYETATGCWSPTSSALVTVDTYVPAAPTATPNNYNICSMTPSLEISATPPPGGPGGTVSIPSGPISVPVPDASTTGARDTLTMVGVPADGVVTAVSVTINMTHTFTGDMDFFLIAPNGNQVELCTDNGGAGDNFVNMVLTNTATNPVTGGVAPFTGSYLPEGSLATTFSVPNGNWILFMQDDAGGDLGTLTNWTIGVTYSQNPVSTIAWYDMPTGGANIGNGVPFETVGTTVMPNTNTEGTHTFYAAATSGGCTSTSTTPITVNITEVLAVLNPVNVTCHGGNDGSFTLGAIQCGSEPFLYSVNGGTFGPIPTDLIAGTYSVVIQDPAGESAPIEVIITEPDVPQNLAAFNVNYFNAQVTWEPQGAETSWTVVYGEVGFDPLTEGESVPANNDTITLIDLIEATDYEFYVYANCGSEGMGGPEPFTTNPGFYTYDNACGPGFVDISATGTLVDFSADPDFLVDDREAGITLPFTLNYQGINLTDISVGMNGGVMLNTLTGEVGYGAGANGIPALFPYAQDLNTHDVYTQTFGTAPNRSFVIQWENATPYSFTPLTDGVTFQVVLNENGPDIYFLYEDRIMGGAANDYGANAEIGVRGPVNINVSMNNATYLTNNACIHFYPTLCPNPTNIAVTAFETEAQVTWDAGLYGETSWTVIYGPEGFDPATSGTTQIVSIPPDPDAQITLAPLEENTEYDVYIYSECQADSITSNGAMINFITKPFCSNPTALAGATYEDTIQAGWNWAINPMYPEATVDEFHIQYGPTGFELGTGIIYETGDPDFSDDVIDPDLIAGGVYQVYVQAVCGVDTVSAYVGPITVVMPLTNDDPCGAEMLAVDGTVYTLNNTGATVATGESAIAPPADGAQVTTGWTNSTLNNTTWFTFVAPPSGSVRVNNTAINYNGQAAVYNVNDCADYGSFFLLSANDNAIGGTSLAPNFTICGLTAGTTYYLLHDGFNTTTGNYTISISPIVLEAGTVGETANICSGSDVNLFTTISGYDNGGTWSSDIAAVDASISGSNFTSEGLAYVIFDFQYRVEDGCAYDSIVSQVHVFAPSNAGEDGSITACRNEPIDLLAGLNGSADLEGTWYNPAGSALANSQITTGNFPGGFNYDYIAGNGVCPNDTAIVVVNVGTCDFLGVDEELFAGVAVYPNPSKGTIFISSDVTEAFDYIVTDAKGRVIAEKQAAVNASEITEINLNNAQTGVYFIRLSNEQTAKTYRVVVQP